MASPSRTSAPKVSKVDLFSEASSDSEGEISVSEEARDPVISLLFPAEYGDIPCTKLTRAQSIQGYRERVPHSSVQV